LIAFWLKWLAGIYLAATLETSLAHGWTVGHVAPDFFSLVGLAGLLVCPEARGVWSLALAGLAADLLSTTHPGVGMACFVVGGFAILALRARWPTSSVVGQAGLLAIGACLIAALLTVWGQWHESTGLAWPTFVMRAVGVGLSTGAVGVPVFAVLHWWKPFPSSIVHHARNRVSSPSPAGRGWPKAG